jgi:hypothetical protein
MRRRARCWTAAAPTEEIGAENLHPRVLAAVAMHLKRTAGSQDVLDMSGDSLQRLAEVIDVQIEAASGDDRERLVALRRRLQEALDLIAGLTFAIVNVPQAMGHAVLARSTRCWASTR